MRNILLALLLANILYFMYERFVEEPPAYGVAVVDEDELGPELQLAESSVAGQAAEAAGGEVNPVDLAAMVGRSCVTVGPFRSGTDASAALKELEDEGLRAALRATDGQVFVGHWVHIDNVASRSAGDAMLETLKEGGLGDAYLSGTSAEGFKISLGLFGEADRAERIELQAKSLGLPAVIEPRMRDATVFFVDVGLPPGRGAGSIIRKYGMERVLLRDRATCPGAGRS